MTVVAEKGRCTPGNECRLTVENTTKIEGMESEIGYIRKRIDQIILGVAASSLLLVVSLVVQLIKK